MSIFIGILILPWIIIGIYSLFRKKTKSNLEYEHLTFISDLNVKAKYIGGNEEELKEEDYAEIIISKECLGIARRGDIIKTINWDNLGICRNVNIATERGIGFSRFMVLGVFSLIGSKNTKITNLVEINYYTNSIQKTLFLDYNEKTNEMLNLINKMKVLGSN